MATEKAVRLIREHLQDAIAAEKAFETQFRGFAGEKNSDEIDRLFLQCAEDSLRQYERLTHRLNELVGEVSEVKTFIARVVAMFPKITQLGHGPADRMVQNLIIAYAIENCEIAMYETLAAIADAAGDEDTAALARSIQEEERAAAEKVWYLIAPSAGAIFRKLAASEEVTA